MVLFKVISNRALVTSFLAKESIDLTSFSPERWDLELDNGEPMTLLFDSGIITREYDGKKEEFLLEEIESAIFEGR
jgi:hypothetical protein